MTTDHPNAFANDTHALATGILLGHLLSQGVDAHPIRANGTGDYTAALAIRLPEPDNAGPLPINTILIKVQP